MTELKSKIYAIVRKIPAGKVATYGQIAEALGNPHLSRVVGNAMHKNPVPYWKLAEETGFVCNSSDRDFYEEYERQHGFEPVPCHRVVDGMGKMGSNFGLGGPEVQRKMLEVEGIEFCNDKVDVEKFKFNFEAE